MATMHAHTIKLNALVTSLHVKMHTDWIDLVLSKCYIVPEGMEYIRKQGGVYEIYYPPKTA